MPLTGPLVRIIAGAIAGVLSVGTGAAIHTHHSGGAGTSSAAVDTSTVAVGPADVGGTVQGAGSAAAGGEAHGGAAVADADAWQRE